MIDTKELHPGGAGCSSNDLKTKSLLLLTPGMDPIGGGIQVSARDAFDGLKSEYNMGIVSYGDIGQWNEAKCPIQIEESKIVRLIGKVWRSSSHWDVVLAWHIGMLKLLPFLRGPSGKLVLFLHGIEVWKPQGWWIKRMLNRVDLFLSNSDFTWQRFLEFQPHLRSRPHLTVPLGIGHPLQGAIPNPSQQPRVVITSRMNRGEDYKGHRELIEAWPKVLKAVPDAVLDIVGDGDLRGILEDRVRQMGLQNHILFHGWVSEARKEELMTASRLFAMPSRGEGFGLVYLEAMRLGRPCLVSDCDAGKEVIGGSIGGRSVRQSDIPALATAIVELLREDQANSELRMNCRKRYESAFTALQFQDRLVKSLRSVS